MPADFHVPLREIFAATDISSFENDPGEHFREGRKFISTTRYMPALFVRIGWTIE
jgi:hypothetical protein